MLKGKSFTHLSKEERIRIEVLLNQGLSLSAVARSLPGNLGSIRVLEKCGMRYTGEELRGRSSSQALRGDRAVYPLKTPFKKLGI